jgi:NADH-ubiquinone oxidoreductase chain 3
MINFFFILVPLLALILLAVNFVLASHNPYKEKTTPFECGIHSFLAQNRTQFTISFFLFGLLFLLFDLEILLVYPFSVSSNVNSLYGLVIIAIFVLMLALGFVFELGKNALKFDIKEIMNINEKKIVVPGP